MLEPKVSTLPWKYEFHLNITFEEMLEIDGIIEDDFTDLYNLTYNMVNTLGHNWGSNKLLDQIPSEYNITINGFKLLEILLDTNNTITWYFEREGEIVLTRDWMEIAAMPE